ncbi:MAG: hypothetical protein IK052_01120 [Bacteroidales bacterium]|nr:hypothetical protein [Bacteroidales bacterium]
MLKANRILAAAVLMLSCVFAKAQTDGTYSGFSPYSVYGVGNLHTPGTSWNRGMGGVGLAARNHRFINILNPASVTARDTLSFMADFGLNGRISVFSEGDKRALNTTFNIDDFVISFPMWNHTAFMVGLTPISDVGYKIAYSELQESNLNTGRQSFSSIGNGGMYQVFAAAAGTIWNRLSLGAQVNYSFGNINKKAAMSYESSDARSWQTGDSLQVNNVTAKLGLQYEQPLGRGSSIILGGTYKFSTPINGYHTHYEVKGIDKTEGRYQELLKEKGLMMGNEIGVGLSYKKADDILIEFDYTLTDWRNSGLDGAAGFSNNGQVAFASSVGQSFRLGAEITPNRNDIRYFLKRCTYRAGAYYESSYYTVDGAHVDAVGVTLGMTIPVFRWYNGLSIGLDFGRRGLQTSQVKETYFGFNVGMNIFDIWFKKPHYE